jgi:hypothetical protein
MVMILPGVDLGAARGRFLSRLCLGGKACGPGQPYRRTISDETNGSYG